GPCNAPPQPRRVAARALPGGGLLGRDVRLVPRQGEPEHRAAVDLALGADGAAVALHDALDRGKADTVPAEALLVMQALERAEQLADVLLVEAGTVVADVEGAVLLLPELDPRRLAPVGELPGVAEQVLQQVAQQGGVALRLHAGLDVQVDR